MSKLLFILIAVIFTTASFSAIAWDNNPGNGQAASGKETSGQQATGKEVAKHTNTKAGSDTRLNTRRNTRGPLFKRRPMFK